LSRLAVHGIALWCVAPFLLWLTLYRPFTESSDRAARVPARIGEFSQVEAFELSADYLRQLGTADATWRRYRGPDGRDVFVVAVFHESNWKSVHPPHICLRGSNMEIQSDRVLELELGQRAVTVGRLLTYSLDTDRNYLSCYAYVAPGLVTGRYWRFFAHHAPLALVRQSANGCVIRAETWIEPGPDGEARAERRCVEFLTGFLGIVPELLE
jgi:hypothetical protein